MIQAPAISVIMPCHNRASLVGRVLQAYDHQDNGFTFELIAIDDGSTDDTVAMLQGYRPSRFDLRVIRLGTNAGPANARNHGIEAARAPLLLLVGDDIVPTPSLVRGHVAAHATRPEIGWAVLGRTIWPPDLPCNSLMRHIDGVGAQQFSYAAMRDGDIFDFRHFYTSNVSVKKQLFDALDTWFDVTFPFAAYEDVELAYRLERGRGLRIVYLQRLLAHHYHYYNARAFAVRQEHCGAMSVQLVRKHPELASRFRLNRVAACSTLANDPRLEEFLNDRADPPWAAVEGLALTLAGTCELAEGSAVDQYYLILFEYFVLKGIMEGSLDAAKAERATRALAVAGLAPALGKAAGPLARVLPPPSEDLIVAIVECARECAESLSSCGAANHPSLALIRAAVVPAA
jgi:glycosyltransferase involved in cell wall biosynthesis